MRGAQMGVSATDTCPCTPTRVCMGSRHLSPSPLLYLNARREAIPAQSRESSETMAAMSIAKAAIFNPSHYLRSSARRTAKVFFTTSASKPHNAQPEGGRDAGMTGEAKRKMEETGEKASERANETRERAKEYAREGMGKASEATERVKESVKEGTEKAKQSAEEGKERAKDYVKEGVEKASYAAEKAKGTGKEGMYMAEEKTGSAAEAVQNLGEKAKQTVQGAWGAAKDTTQKIKDTVVGVSETEKTTQDEIDEARKKAAREAKDEDKHM